MALLFNATTDGVATADDAVAGVDVDAFTIFFRIYNVASGGNTWTGAHCFVLGNADAWQADVFRVNAHTVSSITYAIQFNHWFATTQADHITAFDLPNDQWNNIAVSYDRSDPATSPIIYVNGVADAWVTDVNGVGAPETIAGAAAAPDTFFTYSGSGAGNGPGALSATDTYVGDWAFWDRQLAVEMMAGLTSLGWGPGSPVFRRGRQFFYPGFATGDVLERDQGLVITHTSTGTVAHPPGAHPLQLFVHPPALAVDTGTDLVVQDAVHEIGRAHV